MTAPDPAPLRIGSQPSRPTTAYGARAIAGLALAGLLIWLSLWHLTPPPAQSATAPKDQFSAMRAMAHVNAVAAVPHPMGSQANRKVHDYVFAEFDALGLSPESYAATAVKDFGGHVQIAGRPVNIIARLKGAGGSTGRAVLLMTHYDSAQGAPGAADAGACVAALLETARALVASPPLQRDVIFLITDGEEQTTLGALAMAGHPVLKDAGVVLNFEARGSSGPVMLFETSAGNAGLVEAYSKAVTMPVGSSMLYDVYQRMPNGTDFTVLKNAGFAGLNLAFGNNWSTYHTRRDNPENLDPRSLQHMGDTALALARQFGDEVLAGERGQNAVFFSLPGLFVRYPQAWNVPLLAALVVLFCGVCIYGYRRQRLRIAGALGGLAALLVSLVLSAAGAVLIWMLLSALHRDPLQLTTGGTHRSYLFGLGFTALAVAITAVGFHVARRRAGSLNVTAGALLLWLLLAGVTTFAMPGVAYLFVWPALAAIVTLAVAYGAPDPDATYVFAVRLGVTAVGLLTWVGALHALFSLLPVAMYAVPIAAVVLVVGLLEPLLGALAAPGPRLLPVVAVLVSVVLIGYGGYAAGRYDEAHPRQNSVFYALNGDTGKAVWATADSRTDEWTGQFVTSPERVNATEVLPFLPIPGNPLSASTYLRSPAPPVAMPAPEAQVLSDQTVNGTRTVTVRVVSPRQADTVVVGVEPGALVVGGSIGPAAISGEGLLYGVPFVGLPPEGI
ncbi:MAG TPA: M28 family peptidase, partial [Symbiobacteriaceae bacterium]|nr:M28 family peptidase [Symbiobacteriaceae bacterium]